MTEVFEAKVTLLERNRLLLGLALIPLLVALGLVLAALSVGQISVALFAPHLTAAGLGLLVWMWATNPARKETTHLARATHRGVRIGEHLFLPKEKLRMGLVLHAGGRVRVKLVASFGESAEIAMDNLAQARALLRILGLDASQSIASIWVSSLVQGGLMTFLLCLAGSAVIGIVAAMKLSSILPFALMPLALVLCYYPTKVTIGTDGVEVRWTFYRRFIRYTEIESLSVFDDAFGRSRMAGVLLVMRDGDELRLPTGDPRLTTDDFDMLHERIREAMEGAVNHEANDGELDLRRRGRALSAWIRSLRAMGSGANADQRVAPVSTERLWAVVEDACEEEPARAAAAVALGPALDRRGRERLATLAEATVAPRLRIALEHAASGEVGAELEAALAELDPEGESRHAS